MEEITGNDRFGNEYTDTFLNDGQIMRCTQTMRNKEFEFMGDTYSLDNLHFLPLVKNYVDEYHQQISLYKDKYGRLLLHFYDEYINFSGDNDREDYLWVVVEDVHDADELAEASRFARLRTPYIAADENIWMSAHQFVKQSKKQNIIYNMGAAILDCFYKIDSLYKHFSSSETEIQKNITTISRKIFFCIDLLIVTVVLLLMPKWMFGIFPLYLLLAYFRANLSLMMFRNERKAIFGSLIMLLAGIYLVMDTNYMFGNIQWHYYGISHVLLRYIDHQEEAETIWKTLFCWFYFMPFFFSLVRLFSKERINTAKWSDIFLLTYYMRTNFRNEAVVLFFLSVVMVVAQIIGLRFGTILGSFWSVPLAMLGGWLLVFVLKVNWRKVPKKLWIIVSYAFLLILGWASQYLYEEKLILLLSTYALGAVLTSYLISKGTQGSVWVKAIRSVFMTICIFIILPLLSFGYNIFSGMDYVYAGSVQSRSIQEGRSEFVNNTWQKQKGSSKQSFYRVRGMYYIKDRYGKIGLRDREKVLIPVEYEAIENCRLSIPLFFESIQSVKSASENYFLALRKVSGKNLFWLYTRQGEVLVENCISIVPTPDNNLEVIDLWGRKHIIKEY